MRSVEHYGVFVELAPNLAGLAEPKDGVKVGQQASVYIKNLIPEKMKIKLIIIDSFDPSRWMSLLRLLPCATLSIQDTSTTGFILLLYQTKRSKLSLHKIIFSKAKEEPQRFLFFILC